MRRGIALAAAGLVLAQLACGSSSPSGGSVASPTAGQAGGTAATAAPPGASLGKVGDTVSGGGLSIVVNKVTTVDKLQFLQPKAGNHYLIVDTTITNVENDSAPYNPIYAKVKDSDGDEFPASIAGAPQPALGSGTLTKGDKVHGNLAFEVPKNGKGFVLTYNPLVIAGGYVPLRVDLGQ